MPCWTPKDYADKHRFFCLEQPNLPIVVKDTRNCPVRSRVKEAPGGDWEGWSVYTHFLPVRSLALACGVILGLCGGCASFGPSALERTHGRYNQAVHEVEEEEFLRNLVRVRYNDTPTSLNVTSIAAQYELAGQGEARPFFLAPNPANSIFKTFTAILPDATMTGANRPTLSFVPADDSTATRQFLTPISVDTLVFLVQSGWPVSTILRLWVDRLNGVPNASTTSNPPRGLVPDFARFQRVAELLQIGQDRELTDLLAEERSVELSGPFPGAAITAAAAVEAAKNGFQYQPRDDGKTWALMRSERRLVLHLNLSAEASPEIAELESLLNLQPGRVRYELKTTAGGIPDPLRVPSPPSAVLQLVPRSAAEVYFYLANGVQVPAKDVECGVVPVIANGGGTVFDTQEVTRGLFEVHVANGLKRPPYAYVAVPYHGYWFYIDERDQASKTTFGLVLQLSKLDFKRQQLGGGPLLTLPAGR